uniref:Uncharacterized protein n=1 Tax=Arundo donax TaxID=35708 RepID=A0A0A9F080_ARUDO
MSLSTLGFLF